ncbi:MAG: glutamine--scyllo-inositol transaminase [Candidatus Bathyarchaeota archaeon B24]|nr:MAG: glutamine--scyllo-inositol transaminase [Candidatus Bathyarchaeota archaeon B24]
MVKLAIHGGEPVRRSPFPTVSDKSGRNIGREELELLKRVVESGALFRYSGTMVSSFEREFAGFLGVKHAVASTSGTAALHIATGAAGIGPGMEVITSPLTDIGTIIAILGQNAIPVFADIDPDTYNLDPEDVRNKVTDKTRAVIAVHIFGLPADMDPLVELAEEKDLVLIEDCAQAYLAEYKGRLVGTIGDIGCFSLQQSKHMFTGDGGITVTDDDELARKARLFMDKGWDRSLGLPRAYVMLGFNYRMTELQGAVARAQLKKVRWVVERRRRVAESLTKKISGIDGLIPPKVPKGCKHSYWLYPLKIELSMFDATLDDIVKALQAEGIPAGAGYIGKPIYMAPLFTEKRGYGGTKCPWICPLYGREIDYYEGLCPQAEKTIRQLITLPCNEYFTEEDVEDIAEALEKVLYYYRRR